MCAAAERDPPLPRLSFTANLRRHIDCPAADVPGTTVAEVLQSVFAGNPRLRSYVLDDQGAVRFHVLVFVDGRPVADRRTLTDPVTESSSIHVLQALSGG